jgi:hypothetical protein
MSRGAIPGLSPGVGGKRRGASLRGELQPNQEERK